MYVRSVVRVEENPRSGSARSLLHSRWVPEMINKSAQRPIAEGVKCRYWDNQAGPKRCCLPQTHVRKLLGLFLSGSFSGSLWIRVVPILSMGVSYLSSHSSQFTSSLPKSHPHSHSHSRCSLAYSRISPARTRIVVCAPVGIAVVVRSVASETIRC